MQVSSTMPPACRYAGCAPARACCGDDQAGASQVAYVPLPPQRGVGNSWHSRTAKPGARTRLFGYLLPGEEYGVCHVPDILGRS